MANLSSGIYKGQYETPVIGEPQYERAYQDWKGMSGKYSDLIGSTATELRDYLPDLKANTDMYKPGGEVSKYLTSEGSRDIGSDSAKRIAMGMSGLQHGATVGKETSNLRTNVMLTTANLATQALQPYLQLSQTIGALMQGLSGIMGSMPNYASSIKLGTPNVAGSTNITPGV